ncbi:AMP-binding protein [Novosphingobium rosa]|uniref:AMP-binding protein n=1 Tax=Novosphingobium rosa TaxID=76978 RepID=UPI0008347FF5|nr:AMP-binding protein [Novosphingobium rosa]
MFSKEAVDRAEARTLYETFQDTVQRWGPRAAYAVPPMAGRPYHPDGFEISWDDTAAGVEAMRQRYGAAGYGLGHRVAILFHQRPEFLFHFFALNVLGVSVVPVNPDYRVDEIAYLLEHSEARLLLGIDSRLNDLREAAALAPLAPPVVSFDQMPDALPTAGTPAGQGTPGPDTEAAMLYTSGTTGRPKGCILTNLYFHHFGGWYLTRGGLLDMREGKERMYNPLPLHHANCLSISMPAMLMSGGCLVFPDRFHPKSWWADLLACKVTCVHMQGIIPNLLLKLPETREEKAHHVRFGFCAGIEPDHHAAFERRFGFPVVEMWSMSEVGRFLTDNIEPRKIGTRAFGRADIGCEARIVDEKGNVCLPGQPGELLIRHSEATPRRGFFSSYYKNDAATDEAWADGWFHTGDVVVEDASGMMFFMDRRKNIIRRAGENIAAAEVEACLCAHPAVKQAAAIAVPDDIREEEIMACIVPQDPQADAEALSRELLDWCMEKMAYFKAPAWYLLMGELPTGTSQKLQKIALFPAGTDPRIQQGAVDLRSFKKPHAAAKAVAAVNGPG